VNGRFGVAVVAAAYLTVSFAGCDGGGESPSPSTTPAVRPAPLPPPTGLHVSATTPASITFTWNPVGGAIGYAVQANLDEMFTDEDRVVETTETSFTATELEPETRVYVRVAAVGGTADAPVLSAWTTHVTGSSRGPPPEPRTWIGFADPARASLVEGGRFRAVVQVSGELLRSPLVLSVEQSGPAGQVLTPETVEIEAYGHGAVEIVGVSDRRTERLTEFGITLVPSAEGLPPAVALAAESATFSVSLIDGDRRPGCERLVLSATREDFDFDGRFSTARVTLEGPRNVGLRISEPYWEERLEDRDEPPELPIDLSDVPPVTLAIPRSLPYQGLTDGGHRQRISLSWYSDLRFAAVAPGCAPITLRCPVRTILTHGCRR